MERNMPKWLNDAVFYEIYPQSFYDSNGDGIGDINGITEKLDYVTGLGCNALWLNPCFDSPFRDAGYDVRDYCRVAPRYGTNEDLARLFKEAHGKGIHVILDLVAGHTSEEHPWFRASQRQEKNEYTNRFIWTDFCFRGAPGYPFVSGESERCGAYILNFYKCQPALNYGFLHPEEDWQLPMDHPDCLATRKALMDVMRFWLDLGCDGFRVDMAASLVKGDDKEKSGTSQIWQEIRAMLDRDYPEAVLVAEWSNPKLSLKAGFHTDFSLNHPGGGYNRLVRDYQNHAGRNVLAGPGFVGDDGPKPVFEDHSYFRKDDGGSIAPFLSEFLSDYNETKDIGYISLISCNHDTVRPSWNMDKAELRLFYALLFTMPGVPFLYYGDEIGMRYQNLKTHEGGYFRTGSRTPMQWDNRKNLGFSTAEPGKLYLPVDSSEDAPTVQDNEARPDSLLHTVRDLTVLRHEEKDLQASGNFEALLGMEGGRLFAFRRGSMVIALNPSGDRLEAELPGLSNISASPRYAIGGGSLTDGRLIIQPQSFAAFRI